MPSKAFKTVAASALIAGTCFAFITPAFAFGFGGVHATDPAPADPAPVDTYVPWQPMENPTSGWIPPTDIPWTPSESLGMGGSGGTDPAPAASSPTPAPTQFSESSDASKLTGRDLAEFSDEQLTKITPQQAAVISGKAFSSLLPGKLSKLNVLTLQAIPPKTLAALPSYQFDYLDSHTLNLLTDAQIGALSADQLGTWTLDYLQRERVPAINPDVFAHLSSKRIEDMDVFQTVYVTDAQAAAIQPDALKGINAADDFAMIVVLKAYAANGANKAAAQAKLDEYKLNRGDSGMQDLVRLAIWMYSQTHGL